MIEGSVAGSFPVHFVRWPLTFRILILHKSCVWPSQAVDQIAFLIQLLIFPL